MAYTKTVWEGKPSTATPVNAARLNHLETQYDELVAGYGGQINQGVDVYNRFNSTTQQASGSFNNLLTAGQYRGPGLSDGPFDQGGSWWFVEVLRHDDTYVMQRATLMTDSGTRYAGQIYTRNRVAGNWQPWTMLGGGDTGIRRVNDAVTGIDLRGAATIQRVNNTVYFKVINFLPLSGKENTDVVYTVPSGFKSGNEEVGVVYNEGNSALSAAFIFDIGSLILRNLSANGQFSKLSMTWRTNEPWPTVLPGVAA